jgi:hypothetical protein
VGTGLEIVRQAIEHGHSVTAFVASPDRLKQAWHQLDVGDCPPSLGKVGTEIAKGMKEELKKEPL